MPEKTLAAMSGGVDSSVAAALLAEEGVECVALTLKLIDKGDESGAADAAQAARKFGIPHRTLDFTEAFDERVIRPFIESYEKGFTPNPCIQCNRCIKFGLLFSRAGEFGCGSLASGHYARIEKSGGRFLLKKARDSAKDQSYVLFYLEQEKLARIRFPLGGLTKHEVKEIARANGLASAERPESQDICFVPGGDYGAFMEEYTGKRYPPGDILSPDGRVIGRHRGIVRYTLGQRRGLGVAANEPVYVSAKDPGRNTVTLGLETSLYAKTLFADNINLIACDGLSSPVKLRVKTRYLQKEHSARALQTGPDEIRIDFDEAQRALTPGQAAVLYDGETVVGGGIIRSVEP